MDIDEEQVAAGQKIVLQFMVKDRGNLKYLNLAVVFIGFLTYLWAMDELDDNPYRHDILPIVVIVFGGAIIYLSWYWKKGLGAKYLDKIDNAKNAGLSNLKSANYWTNLEKELVFASSYQGNHNDVIRVADIIIGQQLELKYSPNVLGGLLLSSAQRLRALSLFKLGRYNEAKVAYESIIRERTTEGLDCSNDNDILNQCIAKLTAPPNQIGVTANVPHSQKQMIEPSAKICPYCQTQNHATSSQCKLCLHNI
jgi:hypothetical protein